MTHFSALWSRGAIDDCLAAAEQAGGHDERNALSAVRQHESRDVKYDKLS